MLYIYLLCPHSEHQKNLFQSKQSKHFHQRNWFILCEIGSNKVKLPKVGSDAIVPVPVEAEPNKRDKKVSRVGLSQKRKKEKSNYAFCP
jgi:hypothetical protein